MAQINLLIYPCGFCQKDTPHTWEGGDYSCDICGLVKIDYRGVVYIHKSYEQRMKEINE